MSRREKICARFLTLPNDFTFQELEILMNFCGYKLDNPGKTSGSAVRFINKKNGNIIRLHKPHPQKELKRYIMLDIKEKLESEGLI